MLELAPVGWVKIQMKNENLLLRMMKKSLFTIVVTMLVGCGEVKRETINTPETPFWRAAATGNIEAVKQHLDAGTALSEKDEKFGRPPLHWAAGRGRIEVAKLLISKGANVNSFDDQGATPLHEAAIDIGDRKSQMEMTKLLIDKGANVNARHVLDPFKGMTPLDLAIGIKRIETAKLIRKHGGKTKKELEAE